MAKRVCYIHIGPHKTGTSAIQWFLKEHRAELLKQGYFVPESGNLSGGHHALVRKLCGQQLRDQQESVAVKFVRELAETPCEAVVISSETLDPLLRNNSDYAREFFKRIGELHLAPKLVLFPRNQPQSINSLYTEAVKSFQSAEPFEAFVQRFTPPPTGGYSPLIDLANMFHADLIARPFTGETIARGVVPEFLRVIGVDPSSISAAAVRRNQSVGPFTVSVARSVCHSVIGRGGQLTWLQTERCKRKLAAYLNEKGWEDAGYCGLTTALARHIEEKWKVDNELFARRMWDRPWTELFAADINQEFMPNDFEIRRPGWAILRRLQRAVSEMKVIVQQILLDPSLVVEAPWNDLRKRNGLDFTTINPRAASNRLTA